MSRRTSQTRNEGNALSSSSSYSMDNNRSGTSTPSLPGSKRQSLIDNTPSASRGSMIDALGIPQDMYPEMSVEDMEDDNKDERRIVLKPEDGKFAQAIQTSNTKEVLRMLKEVPVADRMDFVNGHDVDGNPLLMKAVYFNKEVDILTLLLDYGAMPNLMNNDKNTALHLACQLNHKQAIITLIYYGASTLATNVDEKQPYKMISKNPDIQANMLELVATTSTRYEQAVADKTLCVVPLRMRSYYRSVFDDLDLRERGALKWEELEGFLLTLSQTGGLDPARPSSKEYFKWWNRSNDGLLTFPDFLWGINLKQEDEERRKKKAKGGKGKGKGKAKAK